MKRKNQFQVESMPRFATKRSKWGKEKLPAEFRIGGWSFTKNGTAYMNLHVLVRDRHYLFRIPVAEAKSLGIDIVEKSIMWEKMEKTAKRAKAEAKQQTAKALEEFDAGNLSAGFTP